jgi:two-component system sensor histidine kinase VicK
LGAAEVLESLEQGDNNANQIELRRKFLSKIDFQSKRLMQLVGELRELTLMEVEMARAEREKVDYCSFIRSAISRMMDTFAEPHAVLTVETPENELRVKIVPRRIEQVLSNLLDNAFRYTSADGTVCVRVHEENDCVVTSVTDSGCGISKSNLSRVFDRFFTTERNKRSREYGSGLGLAIAASIVRSHHGEIIVDSEEGEGTCFKFRLPLFKS